ncbi:lipoate-protein ligase, putative [Theileria annulata]|uniref:lipoate--protein ligase n=1 Tax=Theileria annulata TaxID=5874 RepID=Q4UJ39_THEAN|nr:lipoate-protein ligase, putative [Theileria annulata]CAI72900.1 lipoate-protein ligase, putative [Theileria annulata]|eukprot:XP_953578.1 lipoate-protein ligase, putative [Theileria annulata]
MNKLLIIFSKELNIYFNLSLENYLLNTISNGRLWKFVKNNFDRVLYFWRNSECVIIGRNQNIYSECNLNNIHQNVNIVRRFTGGGAVYQDLGNMCFTIITDTKNYNFNTNSQIICSAISKLIQQKCEPTGRNDMCINGLKFSGSAFKILPNVALHHGIPVTVLGHTANHQPRKGLLINSLVIQLYSSLWRRTILLNINKSSLEKYLTPEKSKLDKHNVKSIESRITNLAQFKPNITYEQIMELDKNNEICNEKEFKECYDKLTDRNWIFGKKLNWKSLKKRFDFGSIEFCLNIKNENVENVYIYSDMLNADFIDYLNIKFNETIFKYNTQSFEHIFNSLQFPNLQEQIQEIKNWILQSIN